MINAHFVCYSWLSNPLVSFRGFDGSSEAYGAPMSKYTAKRIAIRLASKTIGVERPAVLTDKAKKRLLSFSEDLPGTIFYFCFTVGFPS